MPAEDIKFTRRKEWYDGPDRERYGWLRNKGTAYRQERDLQAENDNSPCTRGVMELCQSAETQRW